MELYFNVYKEINEKNVNKIILTASGGPFRGKILEELNEIKRRGIKTPKMEYGS